MAYGLMCSPAPLPPYLANQRLLLPFTTLVLGDAFFLDDQPELWHDNTARLRIFQVPCAMGHSDDAHQILPTLLHPGASLCAAVSALHA
jgi:hypothetical protein